MTKDSTAIANRIEYLRNATDRSVELEKELLQNKIETINQQLADGEITSQQAEQKKKEAAELSAKNIMFYEDQYALRAAYIRRNGTQDDSIEAFDPASIFLDDTDIYEPSRRRNKPYLVTTSGMHFTFGYNFAPSENLSIDDYSYKHNNMSTIGFTFLTKLDRKNPWGRFRYGLEFATNRLELNGDRYFTTPVDETIIAPVGFNNDHATFTQVALIAPLHLEIGQYEKRASDTRVRYRLNSGFKVGLGGFIGYNLQSQSEIRFERNGRNVRDIRINDFTTNDFVYGLDVYFGYKWVNVFARYNLNEIFDGPIDAQYVSFGIRFM